MKNTLIILRGLPSSGKTTFASLLNGNICSADDYFYDVHGNYIFDKSKLHQAHISCKEKCERFMQLNLTKIIIANTNVTTKEMKPYFELAEKYGYQIFSVIIEKRHNNENNHNVPNETIERMRSNFEINL